MEEGLFTGAYIEHAAHLSVKNTRNYQFQLHPLLARHHVHLLAVCSN